MSVPIQMSGPAFSPGNPSKLFDGLYFVPAGFGNAGRTYDVSPDGQRFLMIKGVVAQTAAADQNATATPASLVVVEHWFEELKARVGR